MGLFDRNLGTGRAARPDDTTAGQTADERAIARYRYMLNTAPPEAIEEAHAEAFAQLTPEQRRQVLARLSQELPPSERSAASQGSANPQDLARMATRAEIRQPGVLERSLAPAGGAAGAAGPGFGSMLGGSLLGSIAGTVLGSAIAHQFFSHDASSAGQLDSSHDASADTARDTDDTSHADAGDTGEDAGASDSDSFADAGFDGDSGFDSGSFDV